MSITLNDLTTAAIDGTGVFDVLMKANKAHLEAEFNKNRIKGSEYSTVYLGSLTQILQTALQFLVSRDKTDLENQLLQKQIDLAVAQKLQAEAQTEHIQAQTALVNQQKLNLIAEALNIPKQGLLIDAQKEVQAQQKLNLGADKLRVEAETTNLGKQGLVLDNQALDIVSKTALTDQQKTNLTAEKLKIDAETTNLGKQATVLDKQALDIVSKTNLTDQQKLNLVAEALNIPKQGLLIDAQKDVQVQQKAHLITQGLHVEAQTLLINQQKTNATQEYNVLVAQEGKIEAEICKLKAEYDLTMGAVTKTAQETVLLSQKTATEKAQILATGVDLDSMVGRQKALYQAQAAGFSRDAEQKAAQIMISTWNVRRTTDEATAADDTNKLSNSNIGRAVEKLLSGISA